MSELGISLAPTEGLSLFNWLTIILSLIVAILMIWLGRTIYERRSLEKERARSEHMLLSVLQTIQHADTDDPTRPPDLDTLIARARQNAMPDPAQDAWLSGLVARARIAPRPKPVAAPKPKP